MYKSIIFSKQLRNTLKPVFSRHEYSSSKSLLFRCKICGIYGYSTASNMICKTDFRCVCRSGNFERYFIEHVLSQINEEKSVYSIIKQASFSNGNGDARNMDFMLIKDHFIPPILNEELLEDKNGEYIFVEILDHSHLTKKRKEQDKENILHLLETYPHSRLIYINMQYMDLEDMKCLSDLRDEFIRTLENPEPERFTLLNDGKGHYNGLKNILSQKPEIREK